MSDYNCSTHSKLRQRCLPDPTLPEINHSRIVQQKRLFGQYSHRERERGRERGEEKGEEKERVK